MKKIIILTLSLLSFKAYSFCGFYVAKGDSSIFNKASQVVLVRDENRSVITMMNDFEGNYKNFAMVVPVPEVLQKDQINAGDSKIVKHLDNYTAPRLVEYFDADPCRPQIEMMMKSATVGAGTSDTRKRKVKKKIFGRKGRS